MEIETGRLPKDEQVPLLLRGLFEKRLPPLPDEQF